MVGHSTWFGGKGFRAVEEDGNDRWRSSPSKDLFGLGALVYGIVGLGISDDWSWLQALVAGHWTWFGGKGF